MIEGVPELLVVNDVAVVIEAGECARGRQQIPFEETQYNRCQHWTQIEYAVENQRWAIKTDRGRN